MTLDICNYLVASQAREVFWICNLFIAVFAERPRSAEEVGARRGMAGIASAYYGMELRLLSHPFADPSPYTIYVGTAPQPS